MTTDTTTEFLCSLEIRLQMDSYIYVILQLPLFTHMRRYLPKAWGYAEEPQRIVEDYRPLNIWNCSGLAQGGAKHHTAIHAFPHSVIREKTERGESVRTHGLRWGQFNKEMHDAIAHYQPTEAPANSPQVLLFSMMSHVSVVRLGQLLCFCPLPASHSPPAHSLPEQHKKLKSPWTVTLHCSVTTKTSLLSMLFSYRIQNTAP